MFDRFPSLMDGKVGCCQVLKHFAVVRSIHSAHPREQHRICDVSVKLTKASRCTSRVQAKVHSAQLQAQRQPRLGRFRYRGQLFEAELRILPASFASSIPQKTSAKASVSSAQGQLLSPSLRSPCNPSIPKYEQGGDNGCNSVGLCSTGLHPHSSLVIF